MESLYKKKNLKFSGFHKEITKGEIQMKRDASRQKRLSTLRDISFPDSNENINEQHKMGQKLNQIPSRNEMLRKWKEEKLMKQQQKGSNANLGQGSITKPGFCFKKQTSRSLDYKNKTDDSKLNIPNLSNRTGSQNTKLASTVSRSTSQSNKPSYMPKQTTVPVTKSTSTNIKSQIHQKPVVSKSVLTSKPSTQKTGFSSLRTNVLQGKTVAKEIKPIVQKVSNSTKIKPLPSKIAPPTTNARIASRNVSSLPKVTQKLPLTNSKLKKHESTCVSSANKPNKGTFPKPINAPSRKFLSKKNETAKDHCTNVEIKESKIKTGEVFNCDISMIEPSISRKSFAPQNFMFCPPSEWSFPFQIDVSSPFSKLKSNGIQRTSSPIKCEDLKSSGDKLCTTKKEENISLNHNLHKATSVNEKFETFSAVSKCEGNISEAKVQDLNMEAIISEIETSNKGIISTKNCNISAYDVTTNLSIKLPLTALDDVSNGDKREFQEKVADKNGVLSSSLNVEPTLLMGFDNCTSKVASKDCVCLNKTWEEGKSLKTIKFPTSESLKDSKMIIFETVDAVSSQMLVPIDNLSQNSIENCIDSSVPSSNKNSEQNKFHETLKSVTSEILEDNKLVNFDFVDNSASGNNREESINNSSQMLVPIFNPSQNSVENCIDSSVPSSIKNSEQNKLHETLKSVTSEMLEDNKLDNIDVVHNSALGNNREESINNSSQMLVPIFNPLQNSVQNCIDSTVSSSSNNLEQNKFHETLKSVTSEILENNKLVDIDFVDNSALGNNREESIMSVYKNKDHLCLNVTSSGQNSNQYNSLEKINGIIPKLLEDNNDIKDVDVMSSHSTSENGFNGLIEFESHVDQCPNSLSESLKTFHLSSCLSERVSEKVSIKNRKSKMLPKYALESINESIESRGTPCVTPKPLKKLIAEETFTPRRSPRLSEKLNRSGSFESILNIEKPEVMNTLDLDEIKPKKGALKNIADSSNKTPTSCKKKSKKEKDKDFTPRRSQRISEMFRRSSSFESLFEVRRPSVMGSPCASNFPTVDTSGVTYDFDNLVLEDSPKVIKFAKVRVAQVSNAKKVSLLYTPPTRKSIRQSIREDLMSFSPS